MQEIDAGKFNPIQHYINPGKPSQTLCRIKLTDYQSIENREGVRLCSSCEYHAGKEVGIIPASISAEYTSEEIALATQHFINGGGVIDRSTSAIPVPQFGRTNPVQIHSRVN